MRRMYSAILLAISVLAIACSEKNNDQQNNKQEEEPIIVDSSKRQLNGKNFSFAPAFYKDLFLSLGNHIEKDISKYSDSIKEFNSTLFGAKYNKVDIVYSGEKDSVMFFSFKGYTDSTIVWLLELINKSDLKILDTMSRMEGTYKKVDDIELYEVVFLNTANSRDPKFRIESYRCSERASNGLVYPLLNNNRKNKAKSEVYEIVNLKFTIKN